MRPRHRRLVLLPLLGALAGCAVAEGVLRALDVSRPVLRIPDPILGWRGAPGAEGWYTAEGGAYVRINTHGWRDRERQTVKPAGVFRIAILGDSYVEADQVDLDATFASIVEENLSRCTAFGARRVEVLSFGVNGYGTAQQLLALRHHVWRYDPDVVVLTFLSTNDVHDNSRALRRSDAAPYFVIENGELVLDDSFVRTAGYARRTSRLARAFSWLRARVRVVQLVDYARARMWFGLEALGRRAVGRRTSVNRAFTEPSSPEWEEAWRVTERLILTMRDEVVAGGAGFYLVTLSDSYQVNPDPRRRAFFMRESGATDLFYPDRRVRRLALANGIRVITLGEAFLREAERTGDCLHGWPGLFECKGHWNERGHRLAGDLIARRLCRDAR